MHHSPDLWTPPATALAQQYRALASWIEQHMAIPNSISLNWSRDMLIIHLREETFLNAFAGKRAQQNVDTQGTTWLIEDSALIFTCFIPHSAAINQSFVDIPSQKESA